MVKNGFRYIFTNPEDVRLEVKRKDKSGDVFQVILCFSHNDKAYDLKLHTKNYRKPISSDGMVKWDELQKQLTVGQINKIVACERNSIRKHLRVEIHKDSNIILINCEKINGLP